MRILLITLTLTFALASFGAAPAFADKVVIIENGCDRGDHRHHPGHKRWEKHRKHEKYREHRKRREYREVHHYHHESRSRGSASGHFIAVGGPDFGVWVTGR